MSGRLQEELVKRGRMLQISSQFCAGTSDEEGDNKEDSQDRNDTGEACFSPSAFEWQPNPVIFAHLRDEHLQSSDPGPSVAKDTSDCHLKNTAEAAGKFSPGFGCQF